MKKIIAVLLVLVLSLGMLSGMTLAAEMPETCDESDAAVMVVAAGDGETYYFPEFVPGVITWACQDLVGDKTITLLKDADIDGDANGTHHFQIPGAVSGWNKHTDKLTIDLDGHTVTFSGPANLFFVTRFGFNLQNGTIVYNGEKGFRGAIALGTTTGSTAISTGATVFRPTINISNMTMINTMGSSNEGGGGYVIVNNLHGTQLNIENSTIWSLGNTPLYLSKSTQTAIKESAKAYTGKFTAAVTLTNAVVGSGYTYPLGLNCDEYTLTVKDTALVSNKEDGEMTNPEKKLEIKDNGAVMVEQGNWISMLDNGDIVKGKAFLYGEAAASAPLSFDDVKESDWFYGYVQNLFSKGIVSGVTDTTFNPNGNLTYAAALKLLVVGLLGQDPGNFSGGHWALNYLAEAQAAGWTNMGWENLDEPITREAFCEIAAKAKELKTQPAVNKFTDTDNTAVLALVKAGVINGMSETTFAPDNILTRAQISKIISLLLKLK